MRVSIVAAVARGGVIGRDNAIPWRIPEDAQRFRALTMGHPVVMGRRTWESLPDRFRPLPGRRNVVVTRNPDWHANGAERAGSLDDALRLLASAPQAFVIGGGEIYERALPIADELLLTEIDMDVEGDTFFPPVDPEEFAEVEREHHLSGDGVPFAFVTYARTRPQQALHRGSIVTTMERVEVGIRELRLNLSRYVARVRTGTEVIVTDRGRPVARLGPLNDEEAHRARLIREGKLTPARRPKSTVLPPPIALQGEGPLISEQLLEDRR